MGSNSISEPLTHSELRKIEKDNLTSGQIKTRGTTLFPMKGQVFSRIAALGPLVVIQSYVKLNFCSGNEQIFEVRYTNRYRNEQIFEIKFSHMIFIFSFPKK